MSKIKLIVEIEEITYINAKSLGLYLCPRDTKELEKSIKFAIPYNPSGDCISREALKAELEVYRHTRNYKSDEDEAQNDLLDNILEDIDNAPTVKAFTEEDMAGAYNEGYACGGRESKRPQGERAERALAIIDRLRTDGHINNKEQGTLRRAILLPERPQGEWTTDENGYFYCDKCGKYPHDQYATTDFCPKCGADMRGKEE